MDVANAQNTRKFAQIKSRREEVIQKIDKLELYVVNVVAKLSARLDELEEANIRKGKKSG
jgi:hypothetical protein